MVVIHADELCQGEGLGFFDALGHLEGSVRGVVELDDAVGDVDAYDVVGGDVAVEGDGGESKFIGEFFEVIVNGFEHLGDGDVPEALEVERLLVEAHACFDGLDCSGVVFVDGLLVLFDDRFELLVVVVRGDVGDGDRAVVVDADADGVGVGLFLACE